MADEGLFDRPGLTVGAHQHAELIQGHTLLQGQAADSFGDELTLLLLVLRGYQNHRIPFGQSRPETLAFTVLVVKDHPVGRQQDFPGRSVVLFEFNLLVGGKVPLELEDVLEMGASPRVDRLVVVADNAEIA